MNNIIAMESKGVGQISMHCVPQCTNVSQV